MAFRDFDDTTISRRALFRRAGMLGAGAGLATLPGGGTLWAHEVGEEFPSIARLVNGYVDSRKLANLFVTLGWDQEDHAHTVSAGTLGFGSAVQANENSLYRIYSMTKPITGMATMMCIGDGHFELDTPLSEILPAFADMQVLTSPDAPLDQTVAAERAITIRHLLTHTAGLGYIISAKGPLLEAYQKAGLTGGRVSRFPLPGVPPVEDAPSLEAFADRLAELPLIAQPGTQWHYSASIDLLGRVIEVASGIPFAEFLQTRMFDPCGMESTWFAVPASERARLTDNYFILEGRPIPIDTGLASVFLDEPAFPAGGGGLVSSPKDYDRFQRMLLGYGNLDGTQVIDEAAVRLGVSNILPEGVDTSGTWVAGEGFGAGGRVQGQSFGWGGAAGTLASVDFALGLRAGVFTQYMLAETYPLRAEFQKALATDLAATKAAA